MSIIKDNTKGVLEEVDKRIKANLKTAALMVERSSKQICPVDTGTLKRSIFHIIDDRSAVVGTNVEYAPYVEMGTRFWPGKPYLRPALEMNKDKIKQLFKEK